MAPHFSSQMESLRMVKGPNAYLAVLGLGANLGDRLSALRRAAAALAAPAIELVGRSSVYETAPAGGPPQPDYLNAAVTVRTAMPPGQLLDRALEVERSLGRVRPDPVRFGPRTIDIDLLWMSSGGHEQAGLVVPHPRLATRPFALQPLLELIPDATDPRTGQPYADLEAARTPLCWVADL